MVEVVKKYKVNWKEWREAVGYKISIDLLIYPQTDVVGRRGRWQNSCGTPDRETDL